MKLIAKTRIGTEYVHSKINAYFAPDTSAQKMADLLNKNNYDLKPGEIWYVYDQDYMQQFYTDKRLYFSCGKLKSTTI